MLILYTCLLQGDAAFDQSNRRTSDEQGKTMDKVTTIALLIFLGLIEASAASCPAFVPLYRYWNPKSTDHFYTANILEIGTSVPGKVGNHGYTAEGIQAIIRADATAGTVPLYRYWNAAKADHFYTTNRDEIGTTTPGQVGKHDFKSEGTTGYCFPTQQEATVPLYRYFRGDTVDHFYTTEVEEIGTIIPGQVGKHGYKYEGIACYVYPSA